MENHEKLAEIRKPLEFHFQGTAMETHRDQRRGLHCFYIQANANERLILKITDECVMDNDADAINTVISNNCLPILKEHPNKEVVLFNNCNVEVNELR